MPCVVLIVEDNLIVGMGAVAIVEDAACKVYEAANADVAIKMLEAHPEITLLFTDIDMPALRPAPLWRGERAEPMLRSGATPGID